MNFDVEVLGIPEDIAELIVEHPAAAAWAGITYLLAYALLILVLILAVILLQKINHKTFKYLEKKRGKKIHLQFLERAINIAIIVIIVIIPLAGDSIGKSILGSAAVITAVVGFAAQDVIKDMLSGFLISIYKPFDIGDRIELEDGTVGIVDSITMRHVVIRRIDTLRVVIPNSRINSISVLNYSMGTVERSNLFKFQISYDSDIELAKNVIAKAIEESEYSVPGKKMKDGRIGYGPVYFIEMTDSALVMAVTVYYRHNDATEIVKDDINNRVFSALKEAGIEVPYAYTNVLVKNITEPGTGE
ncbi:MAG: mechanosensitive ion channel family protein [Lachnospiraceae bacterium]|nr:mechanosensitive ion channel family protein [Lachnospiraceae bacterium]